MCIRDRSGPAGKTSDLTVGEKFTGQTSGAIAVYAEKVSDTQISYVVLNGLEFSSGETVIFEESEVQGVAATLVEGSPNVSSNFTFDNGQRGTFYDYGSIKKKKEARSPTKSLKVYFSNGYYEDSDKGDITTKNSYDNMHYIDDVQAYNLSLIHISEPTRPY